MRPTHYLHPMDFYWVWRRFDWTGRVKTVEGGTNPNVYYEGRWFFGLLRWWEPDYNLKEFPPETVSIKDYNR